MRGKTLVIGILMFLAIAVFVSAHQTNTGSAQYRTYPLQGQTYAYYPSYNTNHMANPYNYGYNNAYNNYRSYDYRNYGYGNYYNYDYRNTRYYPWSHYMTTSAYRTSHHDLVHYIDRPFGYPEIYNFRPVR